MMGVEMEIGDLPYPPRPRGARDAVYRIYGDGGALLYVGIAGCLETRFGAHRRKPWWPSVARKTAVWYRTHIQAHSAEAVAIETEHPRHNIRTEPLPIPSAASPDGWLHVISRESFERYRNNVISDVKRHGLHVGVSYKANWRAPHKTVNAILVPCDFYEKAQALAAEYGAQS